MKNRKGFTIIEMMVAMAVLSMLVIAMSRIFQQSQVASNTGYNLSKGTLVGRTLLQFVADDLSNCTTNVGDLSFTRVVLSTDASQEPWQTITYEFNEADGSLTRSSDGGTPLILYEDSDKGSVFLTAFDFVVDDESNPTYYDITLSVDVTQYENATAGQKDTKNFTTRVYLQSRNRDKYGKYKL
ncbi:MAG: prepilin-type N-terminal cleavage/methylation domain-containing protein [Kiritimatiellae bacterium]|jgi:prepilin-type N-terminal cleavage/methylation domain-containing protein|nr:prepilin-type N-terminal cleavage/methylation domain-containing protein [Kiritimatiellia bacterium]